MDPQKFENLAITWPDLFNKATAEYFSCGNGWYGIIDAVCETMSQNVEQTRMRLHYAADVDTGNADQAAAEQELLDKYIKDLPVITQIKEKFGRLRIYTNGCDADTLAAISFAERMSGRICEVCGVPGETRNSGWIKTLCEEHNRKRIADFLHSR